MGDSNKMKCIMCGKKGKKVTKVVSWSLEQMCALCFWGHPKAMKWREWSE